MSWTSWCGQKSQKTQRHQGQSTVYTNMTATLKSSDQLNIYKNICSKGRHGRAKNTWDSQEANGLLSASTQMIFLCTTCKRCALFITSASTAQWGLHLLSLCHQQLSLESLMTALSAAWNQSLLFSHQSILSLWHIPLPNGMGFPGQHGRDQ